MARDEISAGASEWYRGYTPPASTRTVTVTHLFAEDPRVLAAGPEAAMALLSVACWCATFSTDRFPDYILRHSGRTTRKRQDTLDRLVATGLIVPMDEPYVVGTLEAPAYTLGPGIITSGRGNEDAKRERARMTPALRAAVIDRDGAYCAHCLRTDELRIDHVMPVALGGRSDLDNLQVLCRWCNGAKSDMHPDEWREHTTDHALFGDCSLRCGGPTTLEIQQAAVAFGFPAEFVGTI